MTIEETKKVVRDEEFKEEFKEQFFKGFRDGLKHPKIDVKNIEVLAQISNALGLKTPLKGLSNGFEFKMTPLLKAALIERSV